MSKPSDYLLSDADNAAIFEQYIRPAAFGEPAAVVGHGVSALRRRPVCVILAGQTGAGKSHAAPAFVHALTGRAPASPLVHLVADTHKPYHPAYAALLADAAAGRCPPGLPSAATGPDARRWLARACAAAAEEQRAAVLVESASRYPQDVVAMADRFRRGGFRVCVVLVAAHATQSRLGLLARFLDGKAEAASTASTTAAPLKPTLPVRLTPRPIHDESYAGLAQLAAWLDGTPGSHGDGDGDSGRFVDAVLVLRRGNRVALTRYWDAGAQQWTPPSSSWSASLGAAHALDAERQRRLPPAEAAQFDADVARLKARHPERAEALDELAAEYAAAAAAVAVAEETYSTDLKSLDADALVARLESDDDG